MGGLSCSCPGGVQVRRTRTTKNRKARSKSAELVYLICSLPMTEAQPEVVAAWIRGHLGDREPSPRRSETWSRARTLPAAHPQQPRNHGHLKESGHQPHPPLPGHQSLYRNHHQIPIKTTHTSHQTTDPTNPLNQIRRPPAPRGLSNTLDPRRRNLRLHPRPRPHQLPRRTRTQKDPTVAQVPRHHRRILHTGYRRPLETFPVAITAVL